MDNKIFSLLNENSILILISLIGLIVFIILIYVILIIEKKRNLELFEAHEEMFADSIVAIKLKNDVEEQVMITPTDTISKTKYYSFKKYLAIFNNDIRRKLLHWLKESWSKDHVVNDNNKSLILYEYRGIDRLSRCHMFNITSVDNKLHEITLSYSSIPFYNDEKNKIPYILDDESLKMLISKQWKNQDITLAYIKMFPTVNISNVSNYHANDKFIKKIQSHFAVYLDHRHYIERLQNDSFIFISLVNKNKAKEEINEIAQEIGKSYRLMAVKNQSFHICYTDVKKKDFNNKYLVAKLIEQSTYHIQNGDFQNYLYYFDASKDYISNRFATISIKVENALVNNHMQTSLTPVINPTDGSVTAQLININIDNQDFNDYHSFLKECIYTDKENAYFNYIYNIIKNLNANKENFIISLTPEIVSTFKEHQIIDKIKSLDLSSFTILLNLTDVKDYLLIDHTFINLLEKIKGESEGHINFGLTINTITPLNEELIKLITLYHMDQDTFINKYTSNNHHALLSNTINLLKGLTSYPLLISKISSWSNYQLAINEGFDLVSGEIFIDNQEGLIKEIDEKEKNEILTLYYKYHAKK